MCGCRFVEPNLGLFTRLDDGRTRDIGQNTVTAGTVSAGLDDGIAPARGMTYWPAAVLVKATSWDFRKGLCAIVGEEWTKQEKGEE